MLSEDGSGRGAALVAAVAVRDQHPKCNRYMAHRQMDSGDD